MSQNKINEQPKDEEISSLYRDLAGEEPSPSIDSFILAAAHKEIKEAQDKKSKQTRLPLWKRLRLPVAVLTTLVVTVSLYPVLEQGPQEKTPAKNADVSRSLSVAESAQPSSGAPARPMTDTVSSAHQQAESEKKYEEKIERKKAEENRKLNSLEKPSDEQSASLRQKVLRKQEAQKKEQQEQRDSVLTQETSRPQASKDSSLYGRTEEAKRSLAENAKAQAFPESMPTPERVPVAPAAAPEHKPSEITLDIRPALPAPSTVKRSESNITPSSADSAKPSPRRIDTEPGVGSSVSSGAYAASEAPVIDRSIRADESTSPPTMEITRSAKKSAAYDSPQSMEAAAPMAAGAPVVTMTPPSSNAASKEMETNLSPQDWLSKIEKFQKAGKTEEARLELKAFKQAYPDYNIPESLKKLLDQ